MAAISVFPNREHSRVVKIAHRGVSAGCVREIIATAKTPIIEPKHATATRRANRMPPALLAAAVVYLTAVCTVRTGLSKS